MRKPYSDVFWGLPSSCGPAQKLRHTHPTPPAVLGRFLHSLNQFCLEEHGREYQVSDYFLYDFAKVWKCSQEASNVMVHNFFKSHHFSAGIQPIPGAGRRGAGGDW